MRVLLWTTGDKVRSPSARKWFYDMHELLIERGVDADLNTDENLQDSVADRPYDIAIIQWPQADKVYKILSKCPNAHIGVLNSGGIGLDSAGGQKKNKSSYGKHIEYVLDNIDFFVVTGFPWRDLLLPFQKRVYLTIDYESTSGKLVKHHTKKNGLVIGYHGNSTHFSKDFFPHGAKALERLAADFDIVLKVITNNVSKQPRIKGVRTEYIEFDLSSFTDEIQTFDIGICPAFTDYKDLSKPLQYIRNSNRVNSLLVYGIPSVASPNPQSCNDQKDGETVLFAVTEEGWYQALRQLIVQPGLRNDIGHSGRQNVEKYFSSSHATDLFYNMMVDELQYPSVKRIIKPPPKDTASMRMQRYVSFLKGKAMEFIRDIQERI